MNTHATLQFLGFFALLASIIFCIFVYMDWERNKRKATQAKLKQQQDLSKMAQNQMCQTAQYIPYVVAPGYDEPASYPIAPVGAYTGPEPQPPDSDFLSSGSQEFD